jgi:hypothetical protein
MQITRSHCDLCDHVMRTLQTVFLQDSDRAYSSLLWLVASLRWRFASLLWRFTSLLWRFASLLWRFVSLLWRFASLLWRGGKEGFL